MAARLQGKIVLVTGAARGIGAACARAFAREGAKVVLTDIRDDLGRKAADAIAADSPASQTQYEHLDVRREEDWERVMAHLMQTYGRLDVLMNNAGITGFEGEPPPHDPENAPLEAWRAVHETNLDGVFLGCKHGIRAMRPTRTGSIINMGSRSGVVGIPGAAAYASSKAAIRNHTKSVALYCAEQGLAVRCNVIQPASILTPMWEPVLGDGPEREQRIAEFIAGTPIARFGTPEEVAAVAVYLASDESSYTTGAEFTIDGGLLAGTAVPPSRAEEKRTLAD
jgi:NAD(P)-dependent dehydrogenase (short-subunit alcohol dehydrogenase family)